MVSAVFDTHNWAGVPVHFWSLVFFVLGCIVGSFLNVCIHRLPLRQSIIWPASHCPNCKYSIPWYLNIPLVSWLWLGGRCRNCGAPISARYFLVELLTGLMFVASWVAFGRQSALLALVHCVFLAGLIAASFIAAAALTLRSVCCQRPPHRVQRSCLPGPDLQGPGPLVKQHACAVGSPATGCLRQL